MNKVLTLGEAIADMLLHANTPLAVAYRKRMAAEKYARLMLMQKLALVSNFLKTI